MASTKAVKPIQRMGVPILSIPTGVSLASGAAADRLRSPRRGGESPPLELRETGPILFRRQRAVLEANPPASPLPSRIVVVAEELRRGTVRTERGNG
jgi:hypothetical protein